MSPRLLHTADWHLGHAFGAFGPAAARRRADQERAVANVVDLAIARRVDAVLIAGDLFDTTRPDAAARATARRALDRLAAEGIPAFAVAGTHDHRDAAGEAPVFEHDNLVWFDKPYCEAPIFVETDSERLWLYGFSAPAGRPAEIESLRRRQRDGRHVALLHGTVIGAGLETAHKDVPVTPAQLAGLGLDYVALGHFHNLACIRHDGRLVGAYAGTIEALRYGESGPRQVLVMTAAPDGWHAEAHAIGGAVCREETVDVTGLTDEAVLRRRLAALGGPTVYARLSLAGLLEEPLDADALAANLAPEFAHLELRDRTDVAGSRHLQDLAREASVRGHAIARLLAQLEAAEDDRARLVLRRALAHLAASFARHGSGAA